MYVDEKLVKKSIITLVNSKGKNIGEKFLYFGPSSKCNKCKYSKTCIGNLDRNRIYKIVNFRENIFTCELTKNAIQVTEVIESEIFTSIPSKIAVEGAVIERKKIQCFEKDCINFNLCLAKGLKATDKYKILKIYEGISCPKRLELKKASIQWILP